jgi:hypothetical protein
MMTKDQALRLYQTKRVVRIEYLADKIAEHICGVGPESEDFGDVVDAVFDKLMDIVADVQLVGYEFVPRPRKWTRRIEISEE